MGAQEHWELLSGSLGANTYFADLGSIAKKTRDIERDLRRSEHYFRDQGCTEPLCGGGDYHS